MHENNLIIGPDDPILITGSNGFIGSKSGRDIAPLRFLQSSLLCATIEQLNLSVYYPRHIPKGAGRGDTG